MKAVGAEQFASSIVAAAHASVSESLQSQGITPIASPRAAFSTAC
jgi:hypothetical protein